MNEGHNIQGEGPSPERFHHHVAAIMRQQGVCGAEREKLGKLRKAAKADGIVLKELDAVVTVSDMTRGEQEAWLGRQRQYLEWLKVPVGTQIGFEFDTAKKPTKENADAAELVAAKGRGFRAGMAEKEPKPPKEEANTSAWMEGWHEGTASIDEALRTQTLRDEETDLDEDLDADLDGDAG